MAEAGQGRAHLSGDVTLHLGYHVTSAPARRRAAVHADYYLFIHNHTYPLTPRTGSYHSDTTTPRMRRITCAVP